MCRYDLVISVLSVCFLLSPAIVTADTTTDTDAPAARPARCFQFTWLGPRFNEESVFMNATCQDATRLASGIPCQAPLVVSKDGTWPDVDYIWRHHSEEASCVLASNDVCAQFTFFFDGHVENSTYMCTRAVDTQGGAITGGCFEQRNGSFATKVCFCRSVPGGVPCNDATLSSAMSILVFFLAIALMTGDNFVNLWKNYLT